MLNHVLGAGAMLALFAGVAAAQPVLLPDGGGQAPSRQVAQGPAPVFEIDRLRHSFDRITDSENVSTQFKFTNTGAGTLVIHNVDSTCGCTVPDLEELKREYAPGESGTLDVVFKPQGKPGMNHQRVTIRTNDPANPATVLTISAHVVRQVYAEPPIMNMGQVHKRGQQDQLVSIFGRNRDFEVTSISVVGSEFFSADIIGTDDEEVDGEVLRRTDIVVSLNPGSAPGHINAVATARTNDPKHELVNIQMAARIQGDVEISPSRIAFGRIAAGSQTEFPVIVRNARGEPFRILGLEESSNLEARTGYEIEPLDPEKLDAYRVTFLFQAGDNPGAARGRLQLKTDVPQEEVVELSFLGRIVGPGEVTGAPAPSRGAGVTITDGRRE